MSLTKWQPPVPRHHVAEQGRVTWLELFFDLVYVAALIQLGDRLADDVSWSGVAAFAGVFTVLWWTWTGTTAFTNQFAVDDITHRVLAFVQMAAVGNLAVLAATTPENWQAWFVLAYLAARLPLVAMYLRAFRSDPGAKPRIKILLGFFGASLAIWVASLALPGDARYVAWGLGLALEFAAPLVARGRGTGGLAHDHHLQERYALFTIIVLGETFVKTLTLVSDRGISIETQVLGGIGFFMLIAIWWTYFDDVADAEIRATSALANNPTSNRIIWVYTHLPLAIGITAFGVAAKKVVGVETLSDYLKPNYAWLLVGTVAVVLLAVAILDLVTASPHYAIHAPERVGPRVVAAAALLGLGIYGATKPNAVLFLVLVAVVVIGQIAVEVLAAHKSEYRINRHVQGVIEDTAGSCAHLDEVDPSPTPRHGECEACVELKQDPVQLRFCLICGHVGCCDDTPGQHAREHYEATGHALIATLERGDDWAYCYLDDVSRPGFIEAN